VERVVSWAEWDGGEEKHPLGECRGKGEGRKDFRRTSTTHSQLTRLLYAEASVCRVEKPRVCSRERERESACVHEMIGGNRLGTRAKSAECLMTGKLWRIRRRGS
jgi:hypothetical protein